MSSPTPNGLTLVLGPPNSGKRGLAVEWWQERSERRPLVVMPTAPDAAEMTAELARRSGGLVGQAQALTFTGLARAITGLTHSLVGEFESTVMVRRLLGSMHLEALGGVADLPGTARVARRLLQELNETGKTADEILGTLSRWAAADPSGRSVAGDLQRLATGYWQGLETWGLTEQAALVRESMSALDEWTRPVAFCGFTSFTQGQRALVERLSLGTEVLLTLDHEWALGIGLCSQSEVERWIGLAAEIKEVVPEASTYASAAIARLERGFLQGDTVDDLGSNDEDPAGVYFLLSSGRRGEAESIAEQIAELIREGAAPGGIAVVVRQVEDWGRLLGDVFGSCGIPYQIDERTRLLETGLGYAFLQAARGVLLGDAERVLSFLRSPYCWMDLEEVYDLEVRYRRGAGRGAETLARMMTGRSVGVMDSLRGLIHCAEPQQIDIEAARSLAERMLLVAAAEAAPGDHYLEADTRAFRALGDALSVIDRHGGAGEPAAVLRILDEAPVFAPAHHVDGAVHILSAQRARARRFDAVFVIGLVEGEFPGADDLPSLLEPGQRSTLRSLGIGLFTPDPGSERALFIAAATRAWRRLYLSARESEDDGSETVPSRFWTEAKDLLGEREGRHLRRTLADQVFESRTAPSLRHYLRACAAERRQWTEDGGRPPLWHRDAAVLATADVLAELKDKDCFSPSSLESYARCPFAWFVERVVGRQEFESELGGRIIGEAAHSVLSSCYRYLAADGLLPLGEENLAEAEGRAEKLIESVVNGPDCPGTAGERRVAAWRLRAMVCGLLQAEAAAGSHLEFGEAELEVGGEDGVDVGGLRVRGRVDRIDVSADGEDSFVFDYKSGSAPPCNSIGTAEALQLPLYLLALRSEREEQEALGGAYVSLSTGSLSGVVSSGREGVVGERAGKLRSMGVEDWEEMNGQVLDVSRSAAEGIRAGQIAQRPDGECPDWCELGPVCRAKRGGTGR